ncbi:hypothetical protein ACFLYT_00220 [Nanoarchaeota archaeon]
MEVKQMNHDIKKLEKIDYQIINLLEKETSGLEFLDILMYLGKDSQLIYKSLKKLIVEKLVILDSNFYKVTKETKNKTTWKAKCPVCGSIRLVHNPDQGQVYCPNPDCKQPSGRPRTFWILTKRMRKKGLVIRRINCAD